MSKAYKMSHLPVSPPKLAKFLNSLITFLTISTFVFFSCNKKDTQLKLTVTQLKQLDSLKSTYKFSDKAWEARGLIPSPKAVSDKMEKNINICLEDLISTQSEELSKEDYIDILQDGLGRFNSFDYDTEEREFIADQFAEIAAILRIDFNEQLNIWLYGRLMVFLEKLLHKDPVIIDSINVKCNRCGSTLKQGIIKKENNIPAYWTIVKCKQCRELVLLPGKENVKEMRYFNCYFVKSLSKEEVDSIQRNEKLREINDK